MVIAGSSEFSGYLQLAHPGGTHAQKATPAQETSGARFFWPHWLCSWAQHWPRWVFCTLQESTKVTSLFCCINLRENCYRDFFWCLYSVCIWGFVCLFGFLGFLLLLLVVVFFSSLYSIMKLRPLRPIIFFWTLWKKLFFCIKWELPSLPLNKQISLQSCTWK